LPTNKFKREEVMKGFPLLLLSSFVLITACEPVPNNTTASNQTSVQAAAQSAAPKPADKWNVEVAVNELDHAKHTTVSDADLVVRCSPKLEAFVLPNLPQLGHMLDTDSDRRQTVRYRLDEAPIHSESWSVSTDFEALFMPTSTLRKLPKAHSLVLEYKPEYVTPMTMTIDLTGLSDALTKAGCRL
jgi:membrane-bound lytic murein transglycosylase